MNDIYSQACLKDHLYSETTSIQQQPVLKDQSFSIYIKLTCIQRPPMLRDHA